MNVHSSKAGVRRGFPQRLAKRAHLTFRATTSRLGIRRGRKIFAIGYNKTGTSSLHHLFERLGYLSYHNVKWRDCSDMNLLHSYDCFSDGRPKNLATLDKHFPNAQYILQVRELDAWIISRLAHIAREKRDNIHTPGVGWDETKEAVQKWIYDRNTYHRFVLDYFRTRADKLLIVNFIRDPLAAAKIARFLGHEADDKKPDANKNPSKTVAPEHQDLLDQSFNELGIEGDEQSYDILAPSLIEDEQRFGYPYDSLMVDAAAAAAMAGPAATP